MPAAPVEPDTFWGDWRVLRFLDRAAIRKAQAIGRGQQLAGWAVILGVPAGLAFMRQRLPLGWHPEPGRLAACAYTCLTATLIGTGAAGARVPLDAPGLSTLLAAPLRTSAVVAKRTAELALLGAIFLALIALPYSLVSEGLLATVTRLPALAVSLACAACQLACLFAIASAMRGAVRPWLRRVVVLAAIVISIGTALAFALGLTVGLPFDRIESLAILVTGALGPATAAQALGWPHAAAVLQALMACGLLALVLAGLHAESLLRAAEEARRVRARARSVPFPGHRRVVVWPRPFGQGGRALVWKALATQLNVVPWPWAPIALVGVLVIGLVLPCIAGSLALGPPESAAGIGCAFLLIIGELAIFPAAFGPLALGGDSQHPTWLLRYPVGRRVLLIAALGVPCTCWTAAGAALALPWALVHPPALATLGVASGVLALTVVATRLIGATFHLLWPPWTAPAGGRSGPAPLRLVAMFPWMLAGGTALAAVAAGLPLLAAVALAGVPSTALIGCVWPLTIRLLPRLELAPPPLARTEA